MGDPSAPPSGFETARAVQLVVANVERVIAGNTAAVRAAVMCLLAGGNLLLEGVPGVGKTTLAKAVARSIGGSFNRVQATPDLLPSDLTGVSVYHQERREFEFVPGPVFANVVLVDEINRATPRTQSALLEPMEERQVTADGVTRPLPDPSSWWPPRTPWSTTGPIRSPRASSTGSPWPSPWSTRATTKPAMWSPASSCRTPSRTSNR